MINWNRVNELRDEVGADDFDEVVTLFLEEVSAALDDIARDGPTPEDRHFLRGSAANLGFDGLALLCDQDADTAALRECYDQSRARFLCDMEERLAV
mgnify:CR=1 FL=1